MLLTQTATDSQRKITVHVNCGRGPLRFRINLDLERFSHRIMYDCFAAGRLYEPEVSAFLARALRTDDVFVDVGAHVGYFSLLAAALVGPAGAVFSFEPEPRNFSELERHAQENGFAQICAFNSPVDEEAREVTFFFNPDNDGGHALWDPGRHPFNQHTRVHGCKTFVRAVALQDIEPLRNRAARVIKVDTEGAEQRVLAGARRLLAERRAPFLICEINSFGLRQMHSSQMALRSFMRTLGYETFLMDIDGYRPRQVRPDQSILTNTEGREDVFNVLFSAPEDLDALYAG
jgi:FkbM family methyltransferase